MIGSSIKQLRIANGLSKSEFARRVRVSPTAVHNWEENGINPRPDLVPVIAGVLGVATGALVGDVSAGLAASAKQGKRERAATIQALKEQVAAMFGVDVAQVKVSINV